MKVSSRQKAVGRRQRSAGGLSWLCRRTLRKGYAFPTLTTREPREATPREPFGGIASHIVLNLPESRRLSARCGGKAAGSASGVVSAAFCLLLSAFYFLPTAHGQLVPKANSPLYSSRPYEPRAPTGLPRALNGVGIDQKLNEQLPLDLVFRNEQGEEVKLGSYFGKKPVVLSLVYYQCPMLCNQVLNGMVTAFKVMAFKPGEEFDVVTVSFDPRETPALAAAKKKTYVDYLPEAKRAGAASGWHFLTGDEANIKRITDAVGFRYHYDQATEQFAHASGVFVTTPQGKLARYFYGIEYAPRDLRLGLIEAADNKIGSPVDQLLLYCFHYDPATGKYGAAVMNLIRVAGVVTVIGIVGLLFMLKRRTAKRIHLPAGGAA
ncbi:MAG TPA: SCO family protein [Pyrinomonadaceae bacterium]|nr:SCO family protein [Pyrinomonadaceae bacterium]